MRKLLIVTVALLSGLVFAQTNVQASAGAPAGQKRLSRAEMKDVLARVSLKRTGGHVRRPGSANGTFLLLNAQKLVPQASLQDALDTIDRQVLVQIRTQTTSKASVETAREDIAKANCQIGVILVDEPSLPTLLAAPEEGWGMVNVRNLMAGADDKILASRTRRELLRAFALAAGGIHAAQGDFVMQPVRKASDLDAIKREEYGVILRKIFPLALPYYGIQPWHETTYLKACEEGWAPAPTNEFQKAIWDKVHAPPEKPMKITFDKDKQKPVVK